MGSGGSLSTMSSRAHAIYYPKPFDYSPDPHPSSSFNNIYFNTYLPAMYGFPM